MKYEDVIYEMAKPAKKRDIVLWLLTGGKMGVLFTKEKKEFRKWFPDNINCRCVAVVNTPKIKSPMPAPPKTIKQSPHC